MGLAGFTVRRIVQILAAALILVVPASFGATPKRPAATRKTPVRKPTAKSKAVRGKKSAARRATVRRTRATTPPRQLRPTVDRYLEIETQLARRGYLKSNPDGIWNPESVEALRRFQQEQNLTADGRLNSLSLIALGLGPQRDTASAAPPPGPPATVPMP